MAAQANQDETSDSRRLWLTGQQPQGMQHRSPDRSSPYAELKGLIKDAGLLRPQPAYYTYKSVSILTLLAVSAAIVLLQPPIWLQMLNAVFLALIFTQLGFLFHDICHRALARRGRRNIVLGLLVGNLLTGISRAWWSDNHNAHHSHPNVEGLDPNIDIPILAFSEAQALRTRGLARFIVTYQEYFLFPIFCLQGFNMLIQSVLFLRRSPQTPLVRTELSLLLLHYLLYGGLILTVLGPWVGGLFILVHQALIGLYAGSVFAPNHKGMPILEPGAQIGFLHQQVLTSRNVRGHPLTDFWYGGLNYQIEHHLFPTMPRNKLPQAQVIIKAFCAAHDIAYCETGMLASYREILRHVRHVSAPLRV